jgi:hypothetical protein
VYGIEKFAPLPSQQRPPSLLPSQAYGSNSYEQQEEQQERSDKVEEEEEQQQQQQQQQKQQQQKKKKQFSKRERPPSDDESENVPSYTNTPLSQLSQTSLCHDDTAKCSEVAMPIKQTRRREKRRRVSARQYASTGATRAAGMRL